MKKQLLIILVALITYGITATYGQTVTCPVPRTVDPICLPSDALHPIAGTQYTYSVTVPNPPGTKEFTWFVTQDQNFIVAGALTANRDPGDGTGTWVASSSAGYNNPPASNSVDITWKAYTYNPLLPVFVVINVKNTASTSDACVSQNMRVYKIQPMNAFTLDIANVTLAGAAAAYETPIDRCIHDIVVATYQAAPEGVVYDFGIDYLYYVVTAANFSTSWKPSVQLTGVDAQETVTAVEWARPNDFAFATPHAFTLAAGTWTSTDVVNALAASGTVGPAGECILVRVTIDHTNGGLQYQGTSDETITLAVDGLTDLAAVPPVGDIHYSSTLPIPNALCGLVDGYQFDKAIQTIKQRPLIQDNTPPAGDDLLPVR
jgi:hypothetical protein